MPNVKMIARHRVTVDTTTYEAGAMFEIDASDADRLVRLGAAVPADEATDDLGAPPTTGGFPAGVVDADVDVEALRADYYRLNSEANALRQEFAEADATITGLQNDIADLEKQVGDLQAELEAAKMPPVVETADTNNGVKGDVSADGQPAVVEADPNDVPAVDPNATATDGGGKKNGKKADAGVTEADISQGADGQPGAEQSSLEMPPIDPELMPK